MVEMDDYGLVCQRTEASVLVSPRDCPCDPCHKFLVTLRAELAALREVERYARELDSHLSIPPPPDTLGPWFKGKANSNAVAHSMRKALAALDSLRSGKAGT